METISSNKYKKIANIEPPGQRLHSGMSTLTYWGRMTPACVSNLTFIGSGSGMSTLTYWGRMTPACVNNLTFIGSGNGLSPGRYQAIVWTNARILLIKPLRTNFSKISIEILYIFIQENTFEYTVRKMGAVLSRSECVNYEVMISCIDCPIMWTTTKGFIFYRTESICISDLNFFITFWIHVLLIHVVISCWL